MASLPIVMSQITFQINVGLHGLFVPVSEAFHVVMK